MIQIGVNIPTSMCAYVAAMFGLEKRCGGSRCQIFLFLVVMTFLFTWTWCYDPCPEYLRRTAAAKPCNIPDSEVEKAFQQAKVILQERNEREKREVDKGKVVNKKVKSAESTHPQANAPQVVRQMELRQLPFGVASNILAKKYRLTPEQVSCGLPKLVLRQPSAASAVQQCVSNETIQCDPSARYRTADGVCNNLNNPTWGSALSCFDRIMPPAYTDNDGFRESVEGGPLPEPRNISLNVHFHVNKSTNYVTHMYMFFGQFLDHDMTLTAASLTEDNEAIECCPVGPDNHPQCAPINITRDDPFYSRFGIRCLNFVRSAMCPYCTAGPRAQIDALTAYIDGSMVYGNSQNETDSLRARDGTGFLRVQRGQYGDLPPRSNDPANDQCSVPADNQICFQTGDVRANQHANLISLQTLFLREHNRLAYLLRRLNPQWGEETIFQEARRIVGAEMQVITYKEYLPITLGSERMSYFNLWMSSGYTQYDPTVNPSLYTEFATAAFRFGHSMINSQFVEYPRQTNQNVNLRDIFFFPFFLYEGRLESFTRGATRSPAQCFDRHVVPDVTNFLYRIRPNDTGLDLAAINIQRGRDHGLRSYTVYVEYCSDGNIRVQNFSDLITYKLMPKENVDILQKMYRNVRDIDLFTGIICEFWNPGAVVGPTATCFIGMQFSNLKFGDRFYFQHQGQPGSFTSEQIAELKKISLSKLICDNSAITYMQPNAFVFADNYNNPIMPCGNIQGMNLNPWRMS